MQSRQDELVQAVIRSAEEAREFWIGFVDFTESMVSLPQIFSGYAKSLGIDSLTPEQKRQAFFNHVLEEHKVRNQSREIYDHIKANPTACTQDIVEGTGWNRHLVETATKIMLEQNLIVEVGQTDWLDPQFEIVFKKVKNA